MLPVLHKFPGVAPFIRRVADAKGCVPPRMVSKATGLEHAAQVQSALGQAVHAPTVKDAGMMVDNALEWLESLELAKAGIEDAILDVCRGIGLPDPPYALKPHHNGQKKSKV